MNEQQQNYDQEQKRIAESYIPYVDSVMSKLQEMSKDGTATVNMRTFLLDACRYGHRTANPINAPLSAKNTFLALIFNAEGEGFTTAYFHEGCERLRRNALYTWMRGAVLAEKMEDVDFVCIATAAIKQLQEEIPEFKEWIDREESDHLDFKLEKFMRWFMREYMNSEPATPNQIPILIKKFHESTQPEPAMGVPGL